jgi:hypothetical protein
MPKPTPKKLIVNKDAGGVACECEVDGRARKVLITFEALDHMFPHVPKMEDRLRLLADKSFITDVVTKHVRAGNDAEPIQVSYFDVRGGS